MTAPRDQDGSIPQDLLVHAYIDDELDAADSLRISEALKASPPLAAEAQNAMALRESLSRLFSAEPVPEVLKRRIERTIGERKRWQRPTWTTLAAAIVLSIGLSSWATWFSVNWLQRDHIVSELVDRHMQRLFTGTISDVASSDRHTVKPWFNGRVTYAPHVVDLASEGFPLAGGRIEVLGSQVVSTLVYKRRLHVISVTEMPASRVTSDERGIRSFSGYNVISWTDGSLSYWAVSDLNKEELSSFATLLRASPSN